MSETVKPRATLSMTRQSVIPEVVAIAAALALMGWTVSTYFELSSTTIIAAIGGVLTAGVSAIGILWWSTRPQDTMKLNGLPGNEAENDLSNTETALRSSSSFSQLEDEEISWLASISREQRFEQGSLIFKAGLWDEPYFCFVMSGSAELRAGHGALARWTAGEIFTNVNRRWGSLKDASVVALDDVDILVVAYSQLLQATETHPKLAVNLLSSLAVHQEQPLDL